MAQSDIERTGHHNRNGLEAWIERVPPFDCILGMCRGPDCPGGPDLGGGSHGRGTARYRWILRGEGLAVQWMYFADEHLPETIKALDARRPGWRSLYPKAFDLGYHAPTPRYDGQLQMEGCDLLGIDCYYDGSGLNAEPGLDLLFKQQDPEAVWAWLERYWHDTFAELMAKHRHRER